jgi:hypothetical protein
VVREVTDTFTGSGRGIAPCPIFFWNRLARISALLLIIVSGLATAQSKRALLIGIDQYAPKGEVHRPATAAQKPEGLEWDVSRWDLPTWPSLNGAVNDVRAMQDLLTSAKFGFPKNEPYMKVLTNSQATRAAILAAMQKYLVDAPAKGDTVVFYYAGHGSQRFNSKTSKPRHLDETIVPSDANSGVFDVRDKEIARILNKALDKGVKVTAIFDSCHSGSITRGIPFGKVGVARFLGYDPRDANDPDDAIDRPEDRKDNSALVFTATQHDQFAREWRFNDEDHGAFTIALIEALRALPADTPASDVFKRVKVVMQGMNLTDQQPSLGGTAARPQDSLFGPSSAGKQLRVAVSSEGVLENGRIALDAGRITGLGKGTELVRVAESKGAGEVRIRIVELEGMNKSMAERVGSSSAKIEPGDLFELDKWVPSEESRLQVWMPPATLASAAVEDFAAEISSLRSSSKISWIDDPITTAPTHVLSWNGTQWVLQASGASPINLGAHPNGQEILNKLGNGPVRLFVNLPPSRELASQINFGEKSGAAVDVQRHPQFSEYLLTGRLQQSKIEYAWIRKEVLEQGKTASDSKSACSDDTSFPLRTNWIPSGGSSVDQSGHDLSEMAGRLARIKLWLDLKTPPGGGSSDFPYQLALKRRDATAGNYVDGGTVRQNETYDLVLHLVGNAPALVDRQWVYVLGIDCTGRGKLLYPRGPEGNQLPEAGSVPAEIPLTSAGRGITIVPPFGLDSYILLVTSERLPDPSILDFEPVTTRGFHAPEGPLGQLLGAASAGTRGMEQPVPSNWSVQYVQIRSAPQASASTK